MSVALSPDLSAVEVRLSKSQLRAKPGDITVRNAAADAFALLLTEAEILPVPDVAVPGLGNARTPAIAKGPVAPLLPRLDADQQTVLPNISDVFQQPVPEVGAILPLPDDGQSTNAATTLPDGMQRGMQEETTPVFSTDSPLQSASAPFPWNALVPRGPTTRAQPVEALSLLPIEPARPALSEPPGERQTPATSTPPLGDSTAHSDESTGRASELGRVLNMHGASFSPAEQPTDAPPFVASPFVASPFGQTAPSGTSVQLPPQNHPDRPVTKWRSVEARNFTPPQPLTQPVQRGAAGNSGQAQPLAQPVQRGAAGNFTPPQPLAQPVQRGAAGNFTPPQPLAQPVQRGAAGNFTPPQPLTQPVQRGAAANAAQPQPLAQPVQRGAAGKPPQVASESRSGSAPAPGPVFDHSLHYEQTGMLAPRTSADANRPPVTFAPARVVEFGLPGPVLHPVAWTEKGRGADRPSVPPPLSVKPAVAIAPRMDAAESGSESFARPNVTQVGTTEARLANQPPLSSDPVDRDPVVRAEPPAAPPLRSVLPEPTVTDTATAALQRSDLPPQDSALRITEPPSTPSLRITAAHIATQVAQAAQAQPNGTTDVTLNPKELGQVRLSLQAVDTTISILIVAERPETAELMRRHIDTLAHEFRGLGYQDISFSFGGRHGGQGDAPPQNRFAGTPQDGAGVPRQDQHAPAPDHADRYIPRRAAAQNSGRGLDLRL